MKKFMDAVKEPSRIEKTDAKDMHRFLSIVTEGKNTTTNRLSMAEQMAVQQYTPETKKNITNPVLNVSKDAKPSMIGKYFKAVEEEITEAQERAKDRAKLIAERVISKMHDNTLEQNYNEAVAEDANLNDTDAFKEAVYSWMANEADSSQMAIILNSPYSKKFRKPPAGSSKLYRAIFPRDRDLNSIKSRSEIVAFATKIQGAKEFIRTLDLDPESPESKWVIIEKPLNAADFLLDFSSMARHYGLDEGLEEYEVWMQGTPQYRSANKNEVVQTSEQTSQDEQGVAEGTDPNKLAASVTVDGEFKEFDLTPLIAKNNWVGTPKQIINLAEKYLGDFLRKRGSAYSNLELTYKGTTLKANQVGDVGAPDLEFESMQDVTEDWMDDMRAMAHKMAPQDKMRERQAERDAQAKAERQQRIQQDIENLPDLISQYNDMEAEYESMGGKNWQYADREQNLSDEERQARGMETSMRQLADRIHTAKTAKNKSLAEGDSGAKYKVRSIGHDAKGDYYISPNTGKKVYKKGVKVGDHENPKTGEHKGVAENKADGINKMFNNLGDPVYANLQRVALLAMQGRQQEASGRLQTVIKDADPDVQKKITDAVNNIKPVTINGKIADSSRLDKSKQHNDWIINTFIPWVQSLLGKQGVAEGGPKGYDSDGNPLGGGYDEYENNWVVTIDGKTWKTFDDERQAYKAAAAIERKYGKKTREYKN